MAWRGRVFISEPFHQGRRVQCHECAGYQRQVVVMPGVEIPYIGKIVCRTYSRTFSQVVVHLPI
jgi:hypothetical protein